MELKKKKILVVEDSDDLRENIISLLELNDYEVISAENGYEGLQIAFAENPDLIIADRMMPVMEGTQMLKELRENGLTFNTPVIFLTAKSSNTDIREGMNIGADDYLTKPFESNDLLNAVRIRLEKKIKSDEKFEQIYKNISQSIPHELRTPLVSMQGFANILIEDYETIERETVKEMAQMIKNASVRLHRTIEKFILFSEAELMLKDRNSFSRLINSTTEIDDLYVKNLFNQKFPENSSELKINISSATLKIWSEHLKIILHEVIDNAVKFSFPNKPIEISSDFDNDYYKLTVKNYGRGMSEDEIKQSEPFVQHNRTYYEQQGNGLGLAIVKRIAEFYNYKIEIKSQKNSYLEFIITLKSENSLKSFPVFSNKNLAAY